jgi:deoxyribonuclease-4
VLLGAHVSISGGFAEAARRGLRLQCEAIQIFSRSPRALRHTKPISSDEAEAFGEALQAAGIRKCVIHANYLINLSSPKAAQIRVSRAAFTEELERAQILEVPQVIFHPGSHMGRGAAYGVRRVAESLNVCLERADAPDVLAVLENTAGQGSSVGHRLERIADIVSRVKEEDRVAVCLDTCHLFAAGYDIRTRNGCEAVMERVDEVLGLERVLSFHLNDSKGGVRSRLDRHEHIGRGRLGLTPFRLLVNDPRFSDLPGLLETPGGELEDFEINLKTLWRLRKG